MGEKIDRRIRKTKAQLRAGLTKLMRQKSVKEITVKELVDEVDINRSTFYLHYTDINQMLDTLEEDLLNQIWILFIPILSIHFKKQTFTLFKISLLF